MGNSAVLDAVKRPGIASIDGPAGRFQYELPRLWSPDTELAKACVLDLASPLYAPGSYNKIFDRSGKNNHGTIVGATWKRLPSELGWYLDFDGSDDKVNCGSDSSVDNIFTGGGSLLVWVKPDSDGQGDFGRIISKGYAAGVGNTGWLFYVREEAAGFVKIAFFAKFNTTDGIWKTTLALVPIGIWSLVGVTYNDGAVGNDPIFYIGTGGVVVTPAVTEVQTPVGTYVSDAARSLLIGDDEDGANNFDGSEALHSLFKAKIISLAEFTATYQRERHSF